MAGGASLAALGPALHFVIKYFEGCAMASFVLSRPCTMVLEWSPQCWLFSWCRTPLENAGVHVPCPGSSTLMDSWQCFLPRFPRPAGQSPPTEVGLPLLLGGGLRWVPLQGSDG